VVSARRLVRLLINFSVVLKTNSYRIDVWGTLTFKQVNDIAKGLFIDYQNDRIVFTDTKEWSLDYRAFVSNYP